MAYAISSGLAIYFVIWWIALFLTLPFGIRSQQDEGEVVPGTEPGAPVKVVMLRKLIWTTIISFAIYGCGALAYYFGLFNIARLSRLMGIPI